MLNPVAIIASTRDRREITEVNWRLLHDQDIYCERLYDDIRPLGNKWQALVTIAKFLDLSHLIITGSDDLLHKDFLKHIDPSAALNGVQQWYIYEPERKQLYHFEYKAKQCLGGGRVYSRAFLDSINWQLFDTTQDRLLDDMGWIKAAATGSVNIIHKPLILAVKGPWPCMNPLKQTLKHPNARLLKMWKGSEAVRIIREEFGYEG
jgi:hypothetical protein